MKTVEESFFAEPATLANSIRWAMQRAGRSGVTHARHIAEISKSIRAAESSLSL